MVSIVTGSGAGLVNSSKDVLGGDGQIGNAASGRAGEGVTVNAATGNLVVQDRDEYLVGVGADVDLLRTYNSQGGWDGDNGDGWRIGYYRRISSFGGVVKRTDADGHEATYAFNGISGKYLTSEGSGQFDSLSFSDGVWTWTDGDTGTTETYETVDGGMNYRLTQVKDAEGHRVKVDYDANKLISAVSTYNAGSATASEVVTLNYSGTQLTKITTSYKDEAGATKTRSVTSYAYTNGRLSLVTTDLTPDDSADSSTYTVSYAYDANGRLQTITQKDGSQQTIDYWGDGSVKSITEQTVLDYWPDGRVKTVRDDRKTGFVYNAVERTTTVTDALGQVTTLKYFSGDNAGQLQEISGALLGGAGFKQTYTYGMGADSGNLLTSTNAKGEVTTYEYAGNGRLSRRTDPAGNVLERTYTSDGLLASQTVYVLADPDGVAGAGTASAPRTTQYIYDTTQPAKRRLAYVLGPQGEVTRYTYNAQGQVQRRVQYSGARFIAASPTFTSLEDWVNGPQKTTLDRQVTDYTYDLRGQVREERHYASETLDGAAVVDGGLTQTTTIYDAFGRLLSSKDTNGNGTTYAYDGLNRLTRSVDANSAITLYTYDDANRKTSVKLDNGLTTVQTFDTLGHIVSSDVLGASSPVALGATKYIYDALGRLRRVQDATGVSVYSLYDVSGRKSADIAANGQLTEYLYDGAGRLIQTVAYATLLSAATLATLSDALGQPTAKTVADIRPAADDANDRITTLYYEAAGRLIGSLDADGYRPAAPTPRGARRERPSLPH